MMADFQDALLKAMRPLNKADPDEVKGSLAILLTVTMDALEATYGPRKSAETLYRMADHCALKAKGH